jgi:hypothetical protein
VCDRIHSRGVSIADQAVDFAQLIGRLEGFCAHRSPVASTLVWSPNCARAHEVGEYAAACLRGAEETTAGLKYVIAQQQATTTPSNITPSGEVIFDYPYDAAIFAFLRSGLTAAESAQPQRGRFFFVAARRRCWFLERM